MLFYLCDEGRIAIYTDCFEVKVFFTLILLYRIISFLCDRKDASWEVHVISLSLNSVYSIYNIRTELFSHNIFAFFVYTHGI